MDPQLLMMLMNAMGGAGAGGVAAAPGGAPPGAALPPSGGAGTPGPAPDMSPPPMAPAPSGGGADLGKGLDGAMQQIPGMGPVIGAYKGAQGAVKDAGLSPLRALASFGRGLQKPRRNFVLGASNNYNAGPR